MDYRELKKVAETKNFTIKSLADAVGLSSNGLKRSIENETMSIKTLRDLCEILSITISEIFGEDAAGSPSWMVSEGEGYSQARQSAGEVSFLRRQIEIKDREIERLWRMLENEPAKKTKSA